MYVSNSWCGSMADLMGTSISHDVAGVTFLALGNGANDISSAYAGLKNGGNQTLLILDDLLGGATFNPIVISASIAIAGRSNASKMDKVAFVRGCRFIYIVVGYTFYFTNKGSITLFESIVLWVKYAMYVAVVIFGELYKTWEQKENHRSRNIINISINANASGGDGDEDLRNVFAHSCILFLCLFAIDIYIFNIIRIDKLCNHTPTGIMITIFALKT